MDIKWLDRSLFISSHFFTLCTNEKLFKKALKHLHIPKSQRPEFVNNWHSNGTAHYFENQRDKTMTCVVCICGFEGKSTASIVGLLAHEATHIWQQIRDAYGEKSPSAELEAYAIQNLTQELFAEFERQTQ